MPTPPQQVLEQCRSGVTFVLENASGPPVFAWFFPAVSIFTPLDDFYCCLFDHIYLPSNKSNNQDLNY